MTDNIERELVHVADRSVGDWLRPRLNNEIGTVGSVVPQDFPAYVRILHRIDPGGANTRWDAVCAATGASAHALMQWHKICAGWPTAGRLNPLGARSSESDPELGSIDENSLVALCTLLTDAHQDRVYYALWNGWGWLYPQQPVTADGDVLSRSSTTFPTAIANALDGPLLGLPSRDYLLMRGPLSVATSIGYSTGASFWLQSANLLWPADHSWCVGTEIDFDSTVVGGSAALMATVLADPALEAWQVESGDSLRWDGDAVNQDSTFGY